MSRLEFRTGRNHPPGAGHHGEGVPRIADAITVNVTGPKIRVYLRRRNHDKLYVALRIDAVRAQPISQHKAVRGMLVNDPERQEVWRIANIGRERPSIANAAAPECLR